MPLAYWRDDYNTGYETIDQQHQHLFAIINALHDAMLKGHGADLLKDTLDTLFEYTLEHFQTEEALMVAHHYPNYAAHVQRHEELKQQVVTMRQKFAANMPLLSKEVSQFLADWLIHHIKDEDQQVIRFFRQAQA